MDSSLSPKDEIWFLRACHHISNALYAWLPRTLPSQDLRGPKPSEFQISTIPGRTNPINFDNDTLQQMPGPTANPQSA